MGEGEMDRIAELIHASVFRDRNVEQECRNLRSAHAEIRFGYSAAQLDLVRA
jgi:hypothetical protein